VKQLISPAISLENLVPQAICWFDPNITLSLMAPIACQLPTDAQPARMAINARSEQNAKSFLLSYSS